MQAAKRAAGVYHSFCTRFEKYLVLASVLGFAGGIFAAVYSRDFSDDMNTMISGFVDGYDLIAPGIILFILTPSLARMFLARRESRFGGYVLKWFLLRKFMACLWAIVFTVLVFGFPLMPERIPSFSQAVLQTAASMGDMALHSPYLWAMYLSVAAAFISARVQFIFRMMVNALERAEASVLYFLPLIPLFMAAVGAYIYGLPAHLNIRIVPEGGMTGVLQSISMFGVVLDPSDPVQMVYVYIFASLLTGAACFMWHLSLVSYARRKVGEFSSRSYFTGYWPRIYPLLWATSSESISTPLNLYLTKKYAPWVKESVRHFVIGIGSYMNVNGTLICVYVLAGVVLKLLGVQVSPAEWLLTVPVVLLISYGVPGIPGELVIFAGPLATLLNLPPDIYPAFLAVYIGIQIGLPDSFRTGNNSTDDYLCTIILDDIYKKEFEGEKIGNGESEPK